MRARRGAAFWTVLLAAAVLGGALGPGLGGCQSVAGPERMARAGGGDGGDGSGMGGTGHRGGIGGTGLRAEGGLGGTGIVGTVTAYGSIVVQNRHIALTRDTRVLDADRSAGVGRLRVGQVVAVVAEPAGGRPVARIVGIRYAVRGPVAWRSPDGRSLEVAGQRVRIAPGAVVEGDSGAGWVEVSGLRRADGTVRATFVRWTVPPRRPEVAVRGFAAPDGTGGVRIGGLRLDGLDPGLAGRSLLVRGTLRPDGTLAVRRAVPDPLLPVPVRLAAVAVEAYVEARPGERLLRVAGLPVTVGPGTRIVGGDLGSLAPDRLVRVVLPSMPAVPAHPVPAERIELLDEHEAPLAVPVPAAVLGPPPVDMPHPPDQEEPEPPGEHPADEAPEMEMEGMSDDHPSGVAESPEVPEAPEADEGPEPPEGPEAPENEPPEVGEAPEAPEMERPDGAPEPPEMEMPDRDD